MQPDSARGVRENRAMCHALSYAGLRENKTTHERQRNPRSAMPSRASRKHTPDAKRNWIDQEQHEERRNTRHGRVHHDHVGLLLPLRTPIFRRRITSNLRSLTELPIVADVNKCTEFTARRREGRACGRERGGSLYSTHNLEELSQRARQHK